MVIIQLFLILFVIFMYISRPGREGFDTPYTKAFLLAHGRGPLKMTDAEIKEQLEKDRYIGIHDNGGVIYDSDFLKNEYKEPAFIEPACYTSYIQDYITMIPRPPRKPFPRF